MNELDKYKLIRIVTNWIGKPMINNECSSIKSIIIIGHKIRYFKKKIITQW